MQEDMEPTDLSQGESNEESLSSVDSIKHYPSGVLDDEDVNLNVVLFEPQIPPNTGNIGRSCVALNSRLHIVEPISFDISEKAVRRAGLDYWPHLDLNLHANWQSFEQCVGEGNSVWCFSRFATKSYYDVEFQRGDYLVFGSETSGLPSEIHQNYQERLVTLPMVGPVRSLNLAVSVGIAMYEAFRQIQSVTKAKP